MRAIIDQIKARLPLSSVVGEYVRLSRKGKDFWGLCPFHKERSSSFVVHDDTGRYHCFGCGEDGDSISFLEKVAKLPFKDALQTLAHKAGVQLPKDFFAAQGVSDENGSLYEVLSQAARYFQDHLAHPVGKEARAYLTARGVSSEANRWFHLGWAPGTLQSGNFLGRAFATCGVPVSSLQEAGLVFPPEGAKPLRDRFRGRLMFPIHDKKGRVIGFGGRTLGEEGGPKYLNSPETAVFEKRQNLYGLWQALQNKTLRDKPVVVVEGYLDVIALQTAGLGRAVAPLGTAMGVSQLLLAWGLSPSPLVCFDGDEAGQAAALKTALQALPLLKPGVCLSFCKLPSGEDPQSLVAKGGTEKLKNILDHPVPLSAYLWDHLVSRYSLKTPESQAMLRQEYKSYCQAIVDREMRRLYEKTFEGRFYEATRSSFGKVFDKRSKGLAPSRPTTLLNRQQKQSLQTHILLLTVCNHPALLVEFRDMFQGLDMPSSSLINLQRALLEWSEDLSVDCEGEAHILEGLNVFLSQRQLCGVLESCVDARWIFQHAKFAQKSALLEEARQGFRDVFACYQRECALEPELEEAQVLFARDHKERSWKRLQKLQEIYDLGGMGFT